MDIHAFFGSLVVSVFDFDTFLSFLGLKMLDLTSLSPTTYVFAIVFDFDVKLYHIVTEIKEQIIYSLQSSSL